MIGFYGMPLLFVLVEAEVVPQCTQDRHSDASKLKENLTEYSLIVLAIPTKVTYQTQCQIHAFPLRNIKSLWYNYWLRGYTWTKIT